MKPLRWIYEFRLSEIALMAFSFAVVWQLAEPVEQALTKALTPPASVNAGQIALRAAERASAEAPVVQAEQPGAQPRRVSASLVELTARPPFSQTRRPPPPKPQPVRKPPPPKPPQVAFVGVLSVGLGGDRAILRNAAGERLRLRVGEQVEGWRVTQITKDEVRFRRGAHEAVVQSGSAAPITATSPLSTPRNTGAVRESPRPATPPPPPTRRLGN